jgi:hypothetical protein
VSCTSAFAALKKSGQATLTLWKAGARVPLK